MTTPFFPSVRIEPTVSAATLSKTQKQFNTLVKKIEALKAQLLEWRDDLPRHNERLRREYDPLYATYNALRFELVQRLDRACTEKRITKNERKKIRQLIPSITAELMTEQPSDAVKSLHDKYSDTGYDEQNEDVDDAVKSMMEDVFGFEIGADVDINDPEQLRAFLQQQARSEHERLQQHQQQSDARRAKRKKSARQIDQEQQQKTEAVQVHKSLQEVFRKLVTALHPDRAPDDAERARRTELMQRVNVAYEKKDLLQLLELQVQSDQISNSNLSAQTDERLKQYNKLLKEQSETLAQALAEAQLPFRFQLGLPPFVTLTTKIVVAQMEQDIRSLQARIASIQHDLRLLEDSTHLKAWLRDVQISKEPEFDEFMDMMSMSPFGAK